MPSSTIKNYSQLFPSHLSKPQSVLRKTILRALELAIKSVMPKKLMEQSLKIENNKLIIQKSEFNLNTYKDIYIIGGGKAVAHMAAYLEELLSKTPNIKYKGVINVPQGLVIDDLDLSNSIQVNYASHPIPDKVGMSGVLEMKQLIKSSSKNSLIFFLVSGGGSALLPLPRNTIDLEDLQIMNTLLLESGAAIREINIVRKHLSQVKGGNLARLIYNTTKATIVSLIISDVVGNSLDSIASGPTVADSSTFNDLFDILKKYKLFKEIPDSIRLLVEEGLKNPSIETPKSGDKCFNNVYNFLLGSVQNAIEVITKFLNSNDFTVNYFSDNIAGEARLFGKKMYNDYFLNRDDYYQKKRNALIGTGELTVTINGKGIGGRNQEMLLSFLDNATKNKISFNFCLMGANLDGIEGNSNAMGALVDNEVHQKVLKLNLNLQKYLEQNDSNSAFKLLGTEIITGPTGCNVNDIMILLCEYNSKERGLT
jgi:glycerate 2-kinase